MSRAEAPGPVRATPIAMMATWPCVRFAVIQYPFFPVTVLIATIGVRSSAAKNRPLRRDWAAWGSEETPLS